MSYVIFLAGGVNGMERYPELAAQIGRYVSWYEPELALAGEQWLRTTDEQDEALEFETAVEAHACWTQSIGTRPWDCKPDRPLTAYHIEILRKGQEPVRF